MKRAEADEAAAVLVLMEKSRKRKRERAVPAKRSVGGANMGRVNDAPKS